MAKTLTKEAVLDAAKQLEVYEQREFAAAILYWLSYEFDEDDPEAYTQFEDVPLELGSEKAAELMDKIDAADNFTEEMALQVAHVVTGWQVGN